MWVPATGCPEGESTYCAGQHSPDLTGCFRPVKITYGPPIDITPYLQEKANMKTAKQLTERVMEEIRSMQNENTGMKIIEKVRKLRGLAFQI